MDTTTLTPFASATPRRPHAPAVPLQASAHACRAVRRKHPQQATGNAHGTEPSPATAQRA